MIAANQRKQINRAYVSFELYRSITDSQAERRHTSGRVDAFHPRMEQKRLMLTLTL